MHLKEKRAKIVNIKKERRKNKTKSKTKNKTKTKTNNKTENKSKTNTFPSYPSSPPAMISGAIQYGVPMTVWRRDDTASPLTPKSPAGHMVSSLMCSWSRLCVDDLIRVLMDLLVWWLAYSCVGEVVCVLMILFVWQESYSCDDVFIRLVMILFICWLVFDYLCICMKELRYFRGCICFTVILLKNSLVWIGRII